MGTSAQAPHLKGAAGDNLDYAITPVPSSARRPTWSVAVVAAGFCIAMSGLFTGSAMAAGLTLSEAIFAAVLGNIILAVYGGLVGAAGAHHGVSTTMLARHAFGRYGAMIIGAVWGITLVGWYSVQTGFFGQTINALWPAGGFITSVRIAALWGGLLMMVTAYIGYRGLSTLSTIAIPLLGILSLWGIVQALGMADIAGYVPPESFGIGKGITLAVGSFAVGAVVQADITRYARSSTAAWIATLLGYVVANSYIIIAGAVTSIATGDGDLPRAMLSLGLGVPALLVLIMAQWTTNDNNLYSSSLGLSNIVRIPKPRIVLICGTAATLLGVAGVADLFVPWLSALSVLIPPIAGVLIADYYILRRSAYRFGPGTSYLGWNWMAFVAWAAGSATGFTLTAGIPALNSILATFAAYLVLMKIGQAAGVSPGTGSVTEGEGGF